MTCCYRQYEQIIKHSFLFVLLFLLSACATQIPVDQRDNVRQEIDRVAEETVSALIETKPEIQQSLDSAVGYFAGRVSATKLPILGGAYGLGVLVNNDDDSRTYLNIKRYDVGAGLGAGRLRGLVIIEDENTFEQIRNGAWRSAAGIETAAGEASSSALATPEGLQVHVIGESGAGAVATARLVNFSVNNDLTDNGLSDISIPNTGFKSVDPEQEHAPRTWDRSLPFLAQKVIDEGYDLPLPYGISINYSNVSQDMYLGSLNVGLNGSEIVPFEFVSFENAVANSEAVQLKIDAWLFPFMNVYGMIGRVDGEAPVDVLLDGNGMLDILGINCPSPDPLCLFLKDNIITLPIKAPFAGTTYGVGAVLAGGWNNWFVTIPFNFTYADMDTTKTEGIATTVTPRFGRVIGLERYGNLALYAGGNYLNAELDVAGTVYLPVPGGDSLQVDYEIEQKNKDKWNILLGYNWDITRRWSWMAEYNGFIGSREAFITSITYRY
jgi:hypothetical protein